MDSATTNNHVGQMLAELTPAFSRQLIIHILECSNEGVVLSDAENKILFVNEAFTKIMGYSAHEIIGSNGRTFRGGYHNESFYDQIWQQVQSSGIWQGEMWVRRKNGEVFPEWLIFSALKDSSGKATHYLAIFSDLTEREASKRIWFLTHHDPLTHLPNRGTFTERLRIHIANAKRNQKQLALLLIDLDRYKDINVSLGAAGGDETLQQIASELQSLLSEDMMLARLGSDEFAIIIPEITSLDTTARIAQSVLRKFGKKKIGANQKKLHLGASIGISIFPNDAKNIDELINSAYTTIQTIKQSGGHNYRFSTQEMQTKMRERLFLESKLRHILETNQEGLELNYQPLVDLESGEVCGAEALTRWSLDNKQIPANKFIPIAESSGLIVALTRLMLERICHDLRHWIDRGINPPPISLNVSALHFLQKNFLQQLQKVLDEHQIDPQYLKLELTENVILQNASWSQKVISNLKKIGIRVAIDDFGTGYSSLSYIKQFSFDQLKIDRSFIKDVSKNHDDQMLTQTIINLAKNLHITAVAEGIETKEQLEWLRNSHCQIGQGFYFSKAISSHAFLLMLQERKKFPVI